MNRELQDAYKKVFMDMVTSNCGLLVGKYDARNGNDAFMHGVSTVMEWIAIRSSEEDYENFNDLFIRNMIESQENAKKYFEKGLDRFHP